MESDMFEIHPERPFAFCCAPTVSCFNTCCRDLNQFVTPYDILRLKQGLKVSSSEFLDRYASIHDGRQTGLPVVSLRTEAADGHRCPFVSDEGCRVYADRPSSCRTYPLVRLASRNRQTGRISARYFLLKEPHCRGFGSDRTQTVGRWIQDQDLCDYNEENDRILELISLKNRFRPGPLAPADRHLFVTALYNLDEFRRQVFEATLAGDDRFDSVLREAADQDDAALLRLAIQWVKQKLFARQE